MAPVRGSIRRAERTGERAILKPALWILWPSFLAACAGELLFFALVDPDELVLVWRVISLSRTAIYSIGFFFFWSVAALSSGLTWLLARPAAEVNS